MLINFRPVIAHKLKHPMKTLFFRSGTLHLANNKDILYIQQYNISFYIDLRTDSEAKKYPIPNKLLKNGLKVLSIAITETDHALRKQSNPTSNDYFNFYQYIIDNNQSTIDEIIDIIFSTLPNRLMIGCYAGKDRTGVILMILLRILGFSKQDVVIDYHSSTDYLLKTLLCFEPMWTKKGLTADSYAKRLVAHPSVATRFIDYIEEKVFIYRKRYDLSKVKKIITQHYHLES